MKVGEERLCTHLPYISGTSLEEWVLAPAGREDVLSIICKVLTDSVSY